MATITRALAKKGSSIIWPSTRKAPTPLAKASAAAARCDEPVDLDRARPEDLVRNGDLAGVDAGLARKPVAAGRLALGPIPIWVCDRRKGAVIGCDPGLGGGNAHSQANVPQCRLIRASDPIGLNRSA